jgi:predicted transglutaminase-like cysteine proteinase
VRQAIKTIVVAAAITAAATVIQQVARANFLPQAVTDKELQQSKSAGTHPFTEPPQFKSDGPAAFTDLQQFKSSGLLQSDGPVAFMDLQQQGAFSYSPLKLDPPPVTSFDNANAASSLAESPQLVSLEQPEPREASAPARDLGLAGKRYDSLEPSRNTDRSPARQLGLPISRIQFDAPALAPMSHTFFCLKYRDDCKVDKTVSPDSTVTLTSDRWAELERVNAAVNRAIVPHPNTKGLAGEVWLISPRAGECHDYAVTKRHELLALGWPEQDLLLSEVVTSWGEHHLVLVIRTSDGDFVADNLNPNIRIWSQTPYQWVRIQSPGNPLIWSTMVNATVSARASGHANRS